MIHIGIVDDHAVVRAGLREFLAGYDDMRVVGEAANGREALELVHRTGNDLNVLVLDLGLPGQSGQDVLAQIRVRAPDLGVLVLSGFPEELYATKLIQQGASGYLNKECAPQMMIDAIRAVAQGRRYMTPAVAELLAEQLGRPAPQEPHERLTTREFQVFIRLARGVGMTTIGDELSLSGKTIGAHRTRLLKKMELGSNGELTYYAVKNRLID